MELSNYDERKKGLDNFLNCKYPTKFIETNIKYFFSIDGFKAVRTDNKNNHVKEEIDKFVKEHNLILLDVNLSTMVLSGGDIADKNFYSQIRLLVYDF